MPNETETLKRTFSLSQIAENIQAQINKIYAQNYWIRAEIGKLNFYPQSGHAYPQLLEKKSGAIVADIRGFIPKHKYQQIQSNFRKVHGEEMKDGMQVLLLTKVQFHPVFGLSLLISDVDPSFTLGEMARLRKEAILRLQREGLFDLNSKLKTPLLFKRLAVVSVETSKGYHDFCEVLNASPYHSGIELTLFPALLQGDPAVKSISDALDRIRPYTHSFDAVAIIRGGGGETGLDCYDSYHLAKVVASFPAPVLTGIGHATNLTVVEQVGHAHFLTPTHLAQYILSGFEKVSERINESTKVIASIRKNRLSKESDLLRSLSRSLGHEVEVANLKEKNKLSLAGSQIKQLTRNAFLAANKRQEIQGEALSQITVKRLRVENEKVTEIEVSLPELAEELIELKRLRLASFEEKRRILDPIETLKRGYSMTVKDGKPIGSAAELSEGDAIVTKMRDGEVKSIVTKK